MPRFASLVTILTRLLLITSPESQARWYNRGYGGRVALGTGVGLGYGYGGGTAAENQLQGMVEFIRAQGEYYESTSRAMINYEFAGGKYINNRKQRTDSTLR